MDSELDLSEFCCLNKDHLSSVKIRIVTKVLFLVL